MDYQEDPKTSSPSDKSTNGSSSVEVQASLETNHTDFKFTCDWDRPCHALVQCNVSKGYCTGVSNVKRTQVEEKRIIRPARKILQKETIFKVLPKAKIRQRKKMKKTIGVQCFLSLNKTPILAQRNKSTQAFLPLSTTWVTTVKSTQTDVEGPPPKCHGFHGYSSIEEGTSKDFNVKTLCGVRKDIFDMYLNQIEDRMSPFMKNESILLAVFMNLHLGLSFSALSIIFSVEENILRELFLSAMHKLRNSTLCHIGEFLPAGTMKELEALPKYFKGAYRVVRVIIACFEIEAEKPKTERERITMFSDTKRTYAFRCFLCFTPSGKICFKSRVYEGQTSFKTIIQDSGVENILQSGDAILAEKELSEYNVLTEKGILVLALPSSIHPKDITDKNRNDANVRHHVERVLRRFKSLKILNEIPYTLFFNIDLIVHFCCSVVNQMPPILRHDH